MKRILAILLLCVPVMMAVAQSHELKSWSTGALEWSDFKGEPGTHPDPSLLMMMLDVVSIGEGDTYNVQAVAMMDCNSSYAKDNAKTDERLKYHQAQFDLLELNRRRLQWELLSDDKESAINKLERYSAQFKEQIANLNKETDNGTNADKLQELVYDTRMRLMNIGKPQVAEFTPGNWEYGFYAGVGGSFPTGDVKEYFGGCAIFTAGLTAGYKRVHAKADISYGQTGFNKPNVFGKEESGKPLQGPMSDYANYLGAGLSLGYNVIDADKIAIAPYVGVNWSGYSWNMANFKYEQDTDTGKEVQKVTNTETARLGNWNWRAGIDFDFKIHNSKFDLTGKRNQYSSIVRVTPFISYANFDKINAKGCHWGISVAYVGLSRSLKIK